VSILTAGDALFKDILLQPEEDSYRLIYADWLEENGEPERAEFIRVSMELANCPSEDITKREVELHKRQERLLTGRPIDWVKEFNLIKWVDDGMGNSRSPYSFKRGFVYKIELPLSSFLEHAEAIFTHHPITEVVLTDKEPYPTTDYEEGMGDHECPGWSKEGDWSSDEPETSKIVGQLFDLLTPKRKYNKGWADYDLVKEAREALSNACVTYGRKFLV
jgi:uncharacterized protein (TIGR02996 family)